MTIDWAIVVAGAIVGFLVGMTGMGGGALMTPILVIFFHINPTAAVSSDLVAAMVMRPIGGGVHIRRRTVRWPAVRALCIGSIPMAFTGVFIVHALGDANEVQNITKLFLGWTLLLASAAIVLKAWIQGRRASEARLAGRSPHDGLPAFSLRLLPTVVIGLVGGLLVGLTSVGSGSLVIIALMLVYPMLRGSELVGTDLVQAVPMVAAAALAHILVGDFQLGLTSSILIGSIPAVWLGARLSSRAPDGLIRPLLVLVLASSSLKLLDLPTNLLAIILLFGALIGFAVWGALDAAQHPKVHWEAIGVPKRTWVGRQLYLAPVGVGAAFAVAYFARIRPLLETVGASARVST
jgi:uncharacterized membrane protein YfcA